MTRRGVVPPPKHHARRAVYRAPQSHVGRYGKPKVSYLTEASARAKADELNASRPREHPATVYRCPTCGAWHVGTDTRS